MFPTGTVPTFKKLVHQATLYQSFLDLLRAKNQQSPFAPGSNTLMTSLIRDLAENLALNGLLTSPDGVVSILERCIQTGHQEFCDILFPRIRDDTFLSLYTLEHILIPAIPKLETLRKRHGMSLWTHFGPAYRKITFAWLEKSPSTVTQTPALLQTLRSRAGSCNCKFCQQVVVFLCSPGSSATGKLPNVSDGGMKLNFSHIGKKNRSHIRQRLADLGGHPVGYLESQKFGKDTVSMLPLPYSAAQSVFILSRH